jgi:hypothetical protein
MPDWTKLTEAAFEELVFALISSDPAFGDTEWVYPYANTIRRDISTVRAATNSEGRCACLRTLVQCRHPVSGQISFEELMLVKEQVALWNDPPFDVIVLATSGRFTDEAQRWAVVHNAASRKPRFELFSRDKLEQMLTLQTFHLT